MKIDFLQKITSLDDKVIKEGDKEITLADVCVSALMMSTPDDSDKKNLWYTLAKKIKSSKEVNLTVEEIVEVKKAIQNHHAVLIVGRSFELIDCK